MPRNVGNPKSMTQHQKGQQTRGHALVAGWNNGTIVRRAREPAPPTPEPPRRMWTRSRTRQNREAREARNQRRSRTRSRSLTSTRRNTTGNSGTGRGVVVPADAASDDMSPAPGRSQHSVGEQSGRSSSSLVAGTSAQGQPSNHGRTPPRRRSEDRSNGRGVPDTDYVTGPAPIQLSINRTSLTTDGLMIATAPQLITDTVIVEIEKDSTGKIGFKVRIDKSRCFVSMVQSGFDADGKLQIGDVILEIGGNAVSDRESVHKAIADAGEYVEMAISRENKDTTF